MRPRPNDRGNPAGRNQRDRRRQASMRPRPNDRGNGGLPDCGRTGCGASMRPRPNDRGNRAGGDVRPRRRAGFNEAAAERPRKYRPRWMDGCRGNGFNEAAAERPRKSLLPHPPHPGPRRFNEAAAERPRKFGHLAQAVNQRIASMRPRPNDRGNVRLMADELRHLVASMRPRPNDRGNAATSTSPARSSSRFNEAAAERPRK